MIVGLDFLDSIKEKVICEYEESRNEFTCGMEAKDYYTNAAGVYSIRQIMIENGTIILLLNCKSAD
ncbi:MAG: hypothetical protein LIP10_06485 [Clostridiales bacterium]|nr:hypothetical protein [Clostridiales bacterium]